jgi:hypothetical protein
LILIIIILSWICNLVLKYLDELVKHNGNDGANGRTNPVDPVFDVEDAGDDARPETASGVEGPASVVYADELGDEEREANADGCDEGCWWVLDVLGKGDERRGETDLCVSPLLA